jgi:AcrR family transcriptional regulator
MPLPHLIKRAHARRDELLDAAAQLFARDGYDATSINRIIDTVGVSKGAFYHHFAAKEDLISAFAERHALRAAEAAQSVLDDPTLDSFARLVGFLEVMRAQKLRDAQDLRAAFAPILRPENRHMFECIHEATADIVRPLISRIIAEGVAEQAFDTSDPEAATDVILHLMTAHRQLASTLFDAKDRPAFEAAASALLRKLTFMGTVIDRILGLPEGSIELVDESLIAALADDLDEHAA